MRDSSLEESQTKDKIYTYACFIPGYMFWRACTVIPHALLGAAIMRCFTELGAQYSFRLALSIHSLGSATLALPYTFKFFEYEYPGKITYTYQTEDGEANNPRNMLRTSFEHIFSCVLGAALLGKLKQPGNLTYACMLGLSGYLASRAILTTLEKVDGVFFSNTQRTIRVKIEPQGEEQIRMDLTCPLRPRRRAP